MSEHRMLSQDMSALFRAMTREAGCRLVLYYSGLLDGLAGDRHPDWIMRDREGKPFAAWFEDFSVSHAFAICPLSGYWDEWAAIQLRELVQGYDPDGIWVDEIPTIGPIEGTLRAAVRPRAATLMPDRDVLDFTFEGGIVRFVVPRLGIHTCVVIDGWVRPVEVSSTPRAGSA